MRLKLHRASGLAGGMRAPAPSRRLLAARVGWLVVFALTMGLYVASIPAQYERLVTFSGPELQPATVRANLESIGISPGFYATYMLAIHVAFAAAWVAVGAVIFWRRSDDRMALLTSLSLVVFGTFTIDNGPGALAQQHPAAWLPVQLLGYLGAISLLSFFFTFPDGRFVPRWTRWVLVLWAVYQAAYYFFPGSPLDLYSSLPLVNFATVAAFAFVIAGSQVYRYRRVSDPVQRQQTKWIVFGIVAAMLGAILFALPLYTSRTMAQYGSPFALVFEAGVLASLLLIPLTIGVAILRYQLWEIDLVINRTLVYGALSASVVGIYALVVGTLGLLLQEPRGSFLVSLLAAGLVAVLFAPLRERLQRGVNRLMYGERDDPYGVLSGLGRRLEGALEPQTVLPTIVETVAGAFRLPYAAIALKQEDGYEVAAAHGSPMGEETILPLRYGGETIGRLVLASRASGETFSSADRRLLEDLARQAEIAVQAVRLNADLQRSRERLVGAREEERRRLRRDLHDGLGPTLATLTLGLDVSLKMLRKNPAEAEAMLRELKSQAQRAVADIRRLVYGLRPPALDDLGLVPAIREQVSRQGRLADDPAQASKNGLLFSVEAPEKLPPLPAAVEVAAYRIAQEAITNVVRHAEARTCRVRFAIDDAGEELELEVADDGVGLPEDRHGGVGMSSMAERAAELGGTCAVSSRPEGGTRVLARLPIFTEEED